MTYVYGTVQIIYDDDEHHTIPDIVHFRAFLPGSGIFCRKIGIRNLIIV